MHKSRPVELARTVVSGGWPILLILVMWDLWVVVNGYTSIVAPRPWAVLADLFQRPDAYVSAVVATLTVSMLGLIFGVTIGAVLAVAVWSSRILSGVITPSVVLMRSVPIVAVIPLLIAVLGSGDVAVIAVTTIVAIFPAFVYTLSGFSSASPAALEVFQVFSASKGARLTRLLIPKAIPELLVAIRLSAPSTVLSAMLAEFLIGKRGLGQLFVNSVTFSQNERAWGTSVVATLLAVLAFVAATGLERRVTAVVQ